MDSKELKLENEVSELILDLVDSVAKGEISRGDLQGLVGALTKAVIATVREA